MQRHVEREAEAILIQAQEVLPEQQMAGARYRQELRDPVMIAPRATYGIVRMDDLRLAQLG